ncbi:NAD(P)H-dependent flavin oxidoreductase [candidate division CSSED10-310 bacterium]|uniref:NAD(P)H-dependent flavin oxidoreductase n=1 Tax=candidate division CSSED10-310 bacterium TaxID=2855610 RepID=A0ABV6YR47_UNCC1
MSRLNTPFTRAVGIEVPIICGAMYPCSNLELVAAVSEAGGIGIIQPVSMIFVHKVELRKGIRFMRRITDKPLGFNAIVEKSEFLQKQMAKWVDIALEEGIRFFVTALGNPRWVVDKVHAVNGVVYHDVTERKWAQKALEAGVDGLICVNNRAGGHAGTLSPQQLMESLHDLKVPLISAGGIGSEQDFIERLDQGFAGGQLGTRFIATTECTAHADYKQAILDAREEDIVFTEKISGVPVAIIKTPFIEKIGTKAGPLAKRLLQHPTLKYYMRGYYSLLSLWQLKKATLHGLNYNDYFQAGKSVAGIHRIESAGTIVRRFAEAARISG